MVLAQKQAHGSRKQNRESREKKKKHIDMVNPSKTKEARIFNGEKTASSIKEN